MSLKRVQLDARSVKALSTWQAADEGGRKLTLDLVSRFILGSVSSNAEESLLQATGWDEDTAQSVLWGISVILRDCAKAKLDREQIKRLLTAQALDAAAVRSLLDYHQEKLAFLQETVSTQPVGALPGYADLEWRIDMELGRRTQNTLTQPSYTIRLGLTEPDTTSAGEGGRTGRAQTSRHLNCDFATLKHVEKQLELALSELKSTHSQRFLRYL